LNAFVMSVEAYVKSTLTFGLVAFAPFSKPRMYLNTGGIVLMPPSVPTTLVFVRLPAMTPAR